MDSDFNDKIFKNLDGKYIELSSQSFSKFIYKRPNLILRIR